MKSIFVLTASFVFFGLPAASCDIFVRSPNTAGDMRAYLAYYNLRIVNNAGAAVTLYGPGIFYKTDTYESLTNVADAKLCRVEADGEAVIEFVWDPKGSLYYGDDPTVPDPPAEELKAAFHPYNASFYFKLVFGEDEGEEVYLVGWPQSIELATEAKEEWDIIIPPRKNSSLWFRLRTEYDFDDADAAVYGNAALTIDAVNDIRFETHGLSTEKAP